MGQTYPALNPAVDGGDVGFNGLIDRTDTLRTSQSGATAPSTPAEGWLWYDTTNDILFYYDGAAWIEVGTVIHSDVDFDLNQLVNARLENTAAVVTPAAGNVGYVILHTGAAKLKVVASATLLETIISLSNLDLKSIPLPLNEWEKDVTNPPTDVTIGGFRTWLFDAVIERMQASVLLPRGYSEDANAILRVHYFLNAAESASDVLAGLLDYQVVPLDSTDLGTKATTQALATGQSIGANAGQYTYHKCDIAMPFGDATNPLIKNSAVSLDWGLDAISSVAAAAVFHAELLTPVGQLGITEIA